MAGCRKDGRLRSESRRSKLRPAARQGQDLLEAQAYICQAHAIFEGLSKAEGLGQVRLQVRTAFQYFVPNACICTAAVSKAALQIVSSPSSDHLLRCTDSSYLQKLLAETGAKHRQLKTGGDLDCQQTCSYQQQPSTSTTASSNDSRCLPAAEDCVAQSKLRLECGQKETTLQEHLWMQAAIEVKACAPFKPSRLASPAMQDHCISWHIPVSPSWQLAPACMLQHGNVHYGKVSTIGNVEGCMRQEHNKCTSHTASCANLGWHHHFLLGIQYSNQGAIK